MKPKLTTEQLLAALPRADSCNYVMNLVDHRGRRFIYSFFVSGDNAAPGWFVWGVSGSGATQIVVRPKVPRRRNSSGARVHPGWCLKSAAQKIADLMILHQSPASGPAAQVARVANCEPERICCAPHEDGHPGDEDTWLAHPWHKL